MYIITHNMKIMFIKWSSRNVGLEVEQLFFLPYCFDRRWFNGRHWWWRGWWKEWIAVTLWFAEWKYAMFMSCYLLCSVIIYALIYRFFLYTKMIITVLVLLLPLYIGGNQAPKAKLFSFFSQMDELCFYGVYILCINPYKSSELNHKNIV